MDTLNTMFNENANTTLNNKVFNCENIPDMHDTMKRLYEAARLLHGLTTQTEIARFLNESPQVINNWERRGMSKAGMLAAQEKLGCSALWLMSGQPPMTADGNHGSAGSDLSNSGQKLSKSLESPDEIGSNISPLGSETMKTSAQRIQAALSLKGLTAAEVASVADVGVEIAAQWLRGEGPQITVGQAVAIQNKYGVNSVWIAKGKGEPGVAIRYADEWKPVPITNWKAIPVVGMAQLGDNGFWADLEYPVGHGEGFVTFPTNDPDAYALKCEGDSMRPRIKAGEFVVIEPNHEPEPGDEVLVKSTDGRVMVKEFLYRRDGRTHLISTNDAHPSIAFTDAEIEKMHFVAGIAKRAMWRPV
jgi:transcriptional regulator with XRE-family HTH domain